MTVQALDEVDIRILQCLLEDSRRSNKEIGEIVHLTGQAVGARVRKLQDLGVIEGYTLRWNPQKIGRNVHAFVTAFVNPGAAHQAFRDFVQSREEIEEMHRVSGEGCYWLRVRITDGAELNGLLDALLRYGNYKVSLSIEALK